MNHEGSERGAGLAKDLSIMEKNDLAIASPCTVDWRTMTPADGGRFCGDCKKVVRDLSTMRERDARTLLKSAQNGELCVRYLYDKHGKIFFAGDKGAPLVPASFLQRAKRAALVAAAVAIPLSLEGCSPKADGSSSASPDDHPGLHDTMGAAPYDKRWDEEPGDAAADAASPDATTDGGTDATTEPTNDAGDAGTTDAETPL